MKPNNPFKCYDRNASWKKMKKALETSKAFDEKSFDKNLPTLEIKKDNFEKGVSLKKL